MSEDEIAATQTHPFWCSSEDQDLPGTQPLHFSVPVSDDCMQGPARASTLRSGLTRPYSRGRITLTGP